jgi:hypothetical protein
MTKTNRTETLSIDELSAKIIAAEQAGKSERVVSALYRRKWALEDARKAQSVTRGAAWG